jgi:hypothetical protein
MPGGEGKDWLRGLVVGCDADEHQFRVVAVFFVVGSGDDEGDGFAIGGDLGIGEADDPADVVNAEARGEERGRQGQEQGREFLEAHCRPP